MLISVHGTRSQVFFNEGNYRTNQRERVYLFYISLTLKISEDEIQPHVEFTADY